MLSILIADRQCVFAHGLQQLLREFLDTKVDYYLKENFLDALKTTHFDIMVLDADFFTKMSGHHAVKYILSQFSHLKILVVSQPLTPQNIKEYFKIGGFGFIERNSSKQNFIEAINTISISNYYIDTKHLLSILNMETIQSPQENIPIKKYNRRKKSL